MCNLKRWLSLALAKIRGIALLLIGSFLTVTATADYHRVEENDPSVSYTGGWTTYVGEIYSGGRMVGGGTGSTVSITFNGTGVTWISFLDRNSRGSTRIYLDDAVVGTTSTVFGVLDVRSNKTHKFRVQGLADTTHVLTIEGTGEDPNFGTGFWVDAFYVETGAVTQLLEENDSAITYTGDWIDIDEPSVSGGSVMASRDAGATATLRYRGSALSWISYRCACAAGIARINWLNSNYTSRVSANAAESQSQALIYTTASAAIADREVKIEVTGDSEAASPWVVIDAFRVQTGSSDGPDTVPPELTVFYPQQGDTVAGRVGLVSDIFDNNLVTSVSHYVDGVQIPYRSNFPTVQTWENFFWVTDGTDGVPLVSNGPHELTFVARDKSGNETRSAPITVVVDNTLPTAAITAPAAASQVTGVVTLTADLTGYVHWLTFYARASDGKVFNLGRVPDGTAPSITRDTSSIPSGSTFELWVDGYSRAGIKITSPVSSVTVQH